MATSVTFRDKEIRNPFLRAAVVVFGLCVVLPFMLVVGLPFIIIGCLLTLPLHFALLLCGRRGFAQRAPDGTYKYHVELAGFARRA